MKGYPSRRHDLRFYTQKHYHPEVRPYWSLLQEKQHLERRIYHLSQRLQRVKREMRGRALYSAGRGTPDPKVAG
jgi:hypothetical protein